MTVTLTPDKRYRFVRLEYRLNGQRVTESVHRTRVRFRLFQLAQKGNPVKPVAKDLSLVNFITEV